MPPIINPPNPYLGSCKVYEGTLISIAGKPRVNAVEFNINLQTGYQVNPRDDVALIIRVNFAQPRIIRSHIQNQQFGNIEDHGDPYRISPYEPFEIKILNEERNNRFLIAINNQHFCEFRHRIPSPAISCLAIDGDLDLHQINIASPDPQPMAPSCPYPSATTGMPMPSLYPSIPTGIQHAPQVNPYPAAPAVPPSGYPATSGPMPTAAYPTGPPPPTSGPAPTPAYYSGYPVSKQFSLLLKILTNKILP